MGAPRLVFDEAGRGMAYYASGRVAACCTAKTSYSSCFYFYRDDKKNTPLCTVDDKFCGMIPASRRVEAPSLHSNVSSPGMMEVGGFFSDFEANRGAPRRLRGRE